MVSELILICMLDKLTEDGKVFFMASMENLRLFGELIYRLIKSFCIPVMTHFEKDVQLIMKMKGKKRKETKRQLQRNEAELKNLTGSVPSHNFVKKKGYCYYIGKLPR